MMTWTVILSGGMSQRLQVACSYPATTHKWR